MIEFAYFSRQTLTMSTRRKFLSTGLGATLGVVGGYLLGRNTASATQAPTPGPDAAPSQGISPMGDTFKGGQIISTWYHGLIANDAAWKVIGQGGQAVDAVEAAARIVELDPKGSSVGLGGRPDREGHVTLDASQPDASQTSPRCLPEPSQTLPKRLSIAV